MSIQPKCVICLSSLHDARSCKFKGIYPTPQSQVGTIISNSEISRMPLDSNPKDLIGATKTPLTLIPPEGLKHIALAMQNGAKKYGAYNWRNKKVQYMIYLDAILRHALSLIDREDIAEDSQVHHLGHIGANVAILLDAIKYGCLIDNRPENPNHGKIESK